MARRVQVPTEIPFSLVASFGPGQLRQGRQSDAIDGFVPRVVATPRGLDDVATVVRAAREERLAIVASGGGTRIDLGNRPRCLDVRLSLAGLTTVIERRPEDMTVTVDAGVTLARLNRALAADRQRLAIDAADPQRATIGGLLSANAVGGLMYGFGQPRDLVLGMTVVDGLGRTLRLGGRVVKNVAGYDLVRLFAGSHGTLGVITEATLRTHPLPEQARTFEFGFVRAVEVEAARAAVFASELPLAGFDVEVGHRYDETVWTLVARVEGTVSQVEYQSHRLAELCGRPARTVADAWTSPFHPRADETLVMKIGATPATLVALADDIARGWADDPRSLRLAGRIADGALRVSMASGGSESDLVTVALVRRAAARHDARAVIERIDPGAKERIDVWGEPPAGLALMRRIKDRFDPDRVLAPERYVGGL